MPTTKNHANISPIMLYKDFLFGSS